VNPNVSASAMHGAPLGDRARRYPRPPATDARALLAALRAMPGVSDVVITEEHVARYFDRDAGPSDDDAVTTHAIASSAHGAASVGAPRVHRIAVRYDGADLAECAARLALSTERLVELHASTAYDVKMIGFMPGFAYLGELDERLVLARRDAPRARIAPSSVAMAGAYTAVYPFASPGGWHLLGTALDFVPFAFALGDRVRFEPA
jgi:UPF0271 protein